MAPIAAPVKRSALARRHRALGAAMAARDGWEVAGRFAAPEEEARRAREGAVLADVSWIGKLEVKGVDPKVQAPSPAGSRRVWRLARGQWIVTFEPEDREAAEREIRALASLYPCVRMTDVTSALAALLLAGPRSRDVLAKLTSLDLSERAMADLACGQASLAQVHALVLRQDLGTLPAFRLLVGRESAEHVWDAVVHAGRDLDLAPAGLEALALLGAGG